MATSRPDRKPLWTCTKCGHQFVTANLWHSCTRYTLDHHFEGRDPALRRLFNKWLAFVRKHGGPVTVISQKTRITFMVRVRFAGAIIRKNHVECSMWLKHREASPRFAKIAEYMPGNFFHYFHLTDAAQLDAELARLVREAYAIGSQKEAA